MPLAVPAKDDFQTFVDRLFADFPRLEFPYAPVPFVASPPMDVYEKDGKYALELAVPGYEPSEIAVEIEGSNVTVSGTHVEKDEKKTARYHKREIRRGSFTRTVTLPQDVNTENVIATVENGVLTVTLTPMKTIAPKKVEVKPANGKR